MMKKINRVVFLDWNGTLSPTRFWEHLSRSDKEKKRNLFRLWWDSLFVRHKEMLDPWMRGQYDTEYMLRLVAKDTKSSFKEVLRELVFSCKNMRFSSSVVPSLIERLKNKPVLVVLATNNMDSFSRWTVPAMKLDTLFDEILNSYDLRALKHDVDESGESTFFRDFFKSYKVNPSNCVFIDDGEDKNEVISNLGIDFRRLDECTGLIDHLEQIINIEPVSKL